MFVIVWERAGGGGHQVALTLDRAEAVHRAVSRALPGAECRIEPADGFGPKVAVPMPESRPRRQEQRPRQPRGQRRR